MGNTRVNSTTVNISSPVDEIYTVSNEFIVERDQHYTVNVTYTIEEKHIFTDSTNFTEQYDAMMLIIYSTPFSLIFTYSSFLDTYSVQSVSLTDTTGNRVFLQCVFSSFSTDSGCTVTS